MGERYPSPIEFTGLGDEMARISPIDPEEEEEKISGDKISSLSPPGMNSSGSYKRQKISNPDVIMQHRYLVQ